MSISWSDVPFISIAPPHCPQCRSLRPITVHTFNNGDGSKTRYSICRSCSTRFRLIIELPDNDEFPYFGNADHDV